MPPLEPIGGARPPGRHQGAMLEGGKVDPAWQEDTPSAHHTPTAVMLTFRRGAPLFHVSIFPEFTLSIG